MVDYVNKIKSKINEEKEVYEGLDNAEKRSVLAGITGVLVGTASYAGIIGVTVAALLGGLSKEQSYDTTADLSVADNDNISPISEQVKSLDVYPTVPSITTGSDYLDGLGNFSTVIGLDGKKYVDPSSLKGVHKDKLPPGILDDPELLKEYTDPIAIAKSLSNKSIAMIYEGVDGDISVLSYPEGPDFARMVNTDNKCSNDTGKYPFMLNPETGEITVNYGDNSGDKCFMLAGKPLAGNMPKWVKTKKNSYGTGFVEYNLSDVKDMAALMNNKHLRNIFRNNDKSLDNEYTFEDRTITTSNVEAQVVSTLPIGDISDVKKYGIDVSLFVTGKNLEYTNSTNDNSTTELSGFDVANIEIGSVEKVEGYVNLYSAIVNTGDDNVTVYFAEDITINENGINENGEINVDNSSVYGVSKKMDKETKKVYEQILNGDFDHNKFLLNRHGYYGNILMSKDNFVDIGYNDDDNSHKAIGVSSDGEVSTDGEYRLNDEKGNSKYNQDPNTTQNIFDLLNQISEGSIDYTNLACEDFGNNDFACVATCVNNTIKMKEGDYNLYGGSGLDGKKVKKAVDSVTPRGGGGGKTAPSGSTGSGGRDADDGSGGSNGTPEAN